MTTTPPSADAREGSGAAEGDVVAAMADKLRRGARLFTDVGDQQRARRATDVLLLTTSLVGIVMIGLVAVPEPGYSRAITDFMGALPDALIGMWQLLADLPILWGIVVLGAALVRRRGKIARDMLLALVVGALMWLVISRVVNGSWPELDVLFRNAAPPPVFPAARLAIPTALIVTASPHLVRPARRIGYTVIALGSIAALALQSSTSLGIVAALLSAAGAAAIVHLIVGSSAGRPSLDDVRYALADMNVPVVRPRVWPTARTPDSSPWPPAAPTAVDSSSSSTVATLTMLRSCPRCGGRSGCANPGRRWVSASPPGRTRSAPHAAGRAGGHRHRLGGDGGRDAQRRCRAGAATYC
jgi:hypothetical protein